MTTLEMEVNELGRQSCEPSFTTVLARRPGKRYRTRKLLRRRREEEV
jgi:hypothetical protein